MRTALERDLLNLNQIGRMKTRSLPDGARVSPARSDPDRARHALAALFTVASLGAAAGTQQFPDPDTPVPILVLTFIKQNCALRHGSADGYDTCVSGEMAGYRATVEMLLDAGDAADAPGRYRACAGGAVSVRRHHFHRHRARCMGEPVGILWRFERADKV